MIYYLLAKITHFMLLFIAGSMVDWLSSILFDGYQNKMYYLKCGLVKYGQPVSKLILPKVRQGHEIIEEVR